MGGDVVTGLAQPAHAAAIRMATKLRIVDDDTAPVGGINPVGDVLYAAGAALQVEPARA
jgi:hypothetical protein